VLGVFGGLGMWLLSYLQLNKQQPTAQATN